jgi:hypothetical protein
VLIAHVFLILLATSAAPFFCDPLKRPRGTGMATSYGKQSLVAGTLFISTISTAHAQAGDFASNEMDGTYRGQETIRRNDVVSLFLSALNVDDRKNTVAISLEVVRRAGACLGSLRGLGTAINKTTIILDDRNTDENRCLVLIIFDKGFRTATIIEDHNERQNCGAHGTHCSFDGKVRKTSK